MKFSRFAVERPVFTTMTVLIAVIIGSISLLRLPIDLMPDVTKPTVSISTIYENASPEEIEELVTRPVEEAMSAVPGVQEVTSTSVEGRSYVDVKFNWGVDLDAASNDIRDRLDRVIRHLPDAAERPTLRKFDSAAMPILYFGVSSHLDPVQLVQLINDQVKNRLERVSGVASLDISGSLNREIHVNLYAEKIKALGLSMDQVISQIRNENVTLPAGEIDSGNYELTIRTAGEFNDLDQLRHTVVAMRDGAAVQVKDIAEVDDSWQKVRRIIRVNGQTGLRLSINKQSGKNTVEVAQAVLAEVEKINQDTPQLHLFTVSDTSDYIKRSITSVSAAARDGGILAILVLLFFLRNIRSTLITAAAIPISIIATFALMYFNGFTLNIMTMGGLALGIGRLVDDAIVVQENIFRLRETGQGPMPAAINGTEEVTSAIIASTLTTVVVFLPLAFVRGMVGVMFKQFAFVVGFSLLCSLIIAQTLVPMLSARFLKPPVKDSDTRLSLGRRLFRGTGRMFTAMEDGYRNVLAVALRHRVVVCAGCLLLLAGSLMLVPFVGVEFMPRSDESEVRVWVEMDVGTKLDVLDARFKKIESIVEQAVPERRSILSTVGDSSGGYFGDIRLTLVPIAQRKRSSEAIAADLREKLANIPGTVIRTRASTSLTSNWMSTGSSDSLDLEIRGYDMQVADSLAKTLKGVLGDINGLSDVKISRDAGLPEKMIVPDRQKAGDMKLTVSQIANMLQTILSGTEACKFRQQGDEFSVLVKLKDAQQRPLEDILDMTITNADGQPVVLRNVVTAQARTGHVSIDRKNQERVVYVSARVGARDMGSVMADVKKELATVAVPADFSVGFGGDYEAQQDAFHELLLSLVLALVLVYMVMACLYESVRDPFVVMFSVPMAAIGVIVMLFLTNTTFNVQSYIGCIMLGGIVVSNAILLVDHTNLLRRRDKMPLEQAILEAGRRRLRPILMTSLATLLGLVPLALGMGEGGEAQAPMARAVIGGLLSSTLITLVFVPVVYSLLERTMKFRKSDAAEEPLASAGDESIMTETTDQVSQEIAK